MKSQNQITNKVINFFNDNLRNMKQTLRNAFMDDTIKPRLLF